jgi:transcriptional regulator with XRE-family HTH domain
MTKPNESSRKVSDSSEPETSPIAWIGEVLISARKERGWTQQQLAERAGTQQAAIARWENSKYETATLHTVLTMMHALDMDIQLTTTFKTHHNI